MNRKELSQLIVHLRTLLLPLAPYFNNVANDKPHNDKFIQYDNDDGMWETKNILIWNENLYDNHTVYIESLPERLSNQLTYGLRYHQIMLNINRILINGVMVQLDFNEHTTIADLEQKIFEFSIMNSSGYQFDMIVELTVKYLFFTELYHYLIDPNIALCLASNTSRIDSNIEWYRKPWYAIEETTDEVQSS